MQRVEAVRATQNPSHLHWRAHVVWALIVIVLLLVNLGTVLDERLHTVAHNFVSALLKRSPATEAFIWKTSEARTQARISAATDAAIAAMEGPLLTALTRQQILVRAWEAESIKRQTLQTSLERKRLTSLPMYKAVAVRMRNLLFRSIGSLGVEAIPVVGNVVMIGMTAVDLMDSCDNLRDLASLQQDSDAVPDPMPSVCSAVSVLPRFGTASPR